jgi:hypothetical protein
VEQPKLTQVPIPKSLDWARETETETDIQKDRDRDRDRQRDKVTEKQRDRKFLLGIQKH